MIFGRAHRPRGAPEEDGMGKWDYRILMLPSPQGYSEIFKETVQKNEEILKLAGQEGWEAVSIIPELGEHDQYLLAVLKRPMEA